MDEFLQAQESLKGPGIVGWWVAVFDALDVDRASSLSAAARDPRISHRAIKTVLRQWGFEVTVAQVGHWRRNYVG